MYSETADSVKDILPGGGSDGTYAVDLVHVARFLAELHILMIQSNGTVPWRFQATDYLEQTTGKPLHGKPVAACWDPDLEPAMKEQGFGVDEEQVLHGLLQDLDGSGVP